MITIRASVLWLATTVPLATAAPCAHAAVVHLHNGTTVEGRIDGTLVQRLSVRHQIPDAGRVIQQHIYLLTPGTTVIAVAPGDLHGVPGARSVVVARTIADMAVTDAETKRRVIVDRDPADDFGLLADVLAGLSTLPTDTTIAREDAVLMPLPRATTETHGALPIVGELREVGGAIAFTPTLTVSLDANDVDWRVPIGDLGQPARARPMPRDGVMKARASGSAMGTYRLAAVEAENTMRARVPARFHVGNVGSIHLMPRAMGAVWHFRCALEAPDGLGFNLVGVISTFGLTDERGRELVPFDVLGAGFQGPKPVREGDPPNGYVEFLALGPTDSRSVTVRYGDGAITVPME